MQNIVEVISESSKYEKHRKTIEDIKSFTDTIDERYREKCFEVLLNHYLSGSIEIVNAPSEIQEIKRTDTVKQDHPAMLKIFMQENAISEDMVNKLFLRENGETRPIYKIVEKRKPVAQIQVALLTAFENALVSTNGSFEFSLKQARQRCQDYDVYNGFDFILNFRNHAGLFVSLDYEIVKLTQIGKSELARIARKVIIDCNV